MPHRELFLPASAKTGGIVLPPSAQAEIERDHRELADNLFAVAAVKADFDRDLRDIDPYLELLKAKDSTTVVGLKAGYWHLVRRQPGHPAYIKPLEWESGPDKGKPRDPGSWIFEAAMLDDLWNDRARKAHKKRLAAAERARERRRERESQDRIDEIGERIRSRNRTQILVRRSI